MKRKLLFAAAAIVLGLPATGLAARGFRNSKHDMSYGSSATLRASKSSDAQLCIFCHAPHKPLTQALIWNHTASKNAGFGFLANSKTALGTPLPMTGTNPISPASKKCMDCHDGSVAIGDVANSGGGVAGIIPLLEDGANTVAGRMATLGSYTIGSGGNMDRNHPVSIPYAGRGSTTYNGLTSRASIGQTIGAYVAVTANGCMSPSGLCTVAPTNGTAINLYGSSASNAGIECSSCHSVHDDTNGHFLRVSNVGSALCLSCHNF